MKITNTIIITFVLSWTMTGFSQTFYKNNLEINVDYGFSNDYSEGEFYRTRTFGELLNVESRSSARTRNYTFSFARLFNRNNGLKLSFGLSEFGLDARGRNSATLELINASYRITHLEWGATYVRRFTLSENAILLIEPGLRFHSDGSQSSPTIRISREDAFAFSFYSGVEVPMVGQNFFANLGIQFKIPLESYSYNKETQPAYYPYFIGLKLGINFQFNFIPMISK